MGPIPPGFTWEMQTLFPSPFLGLPPAAEKTGTPPNDSPAGALGGHVGRWSARLRRAAAGRTGGPGPRRPARTKPAVKGGSRTPLGWEQDPGSHAHQSQLGLWETPGRHQELGCAGVALEQLPMHSVTSGLWFHSAACLSSSSNTYAPYQNPRACRQPQIAKGSLAFSSLGRRDNWWPQRHCVLPPGLFLCPPRFKGQLLFQKRSNSGLANPDRNVLGCSGSRFLFETCSCISVPGIPAIRPVQWWLRKQTHVSQRF